MKNYIMCCSAGGNVGNGDGLVKNHSYSLIGVYEFDTDEGRVQLIKIRNPWGQFEWKGDWSDKSALWTPEIADYVGQNYVDDGIFFISLEDYVQEFEWSVVCTYDDHSKLSTMRVSHDQGSKASVVFEIKRTQDVCISLFQTPVRMIPKSADYSIKLAHLKLAKCDGIGSIDVIKRIDTWDPEAILDIDNLEEGTYCIKGNLDWTGENEFNNFVVSVYCSERVELKHLKYHKLARFINFDF